MDQEQVNKIMYQMTDVLDNTQMMHLKKVLEDLSSEEIKEVQKLLGHEKIDTTLHYAMVKQSNVKNAHRKYIG